MRLGDPGAGVVDHEQQRSSVAVVAAVLGVTLLTAMWPAMPLAIPRLFGF